MSILITGPRQPEALRARHTKLRPKQHVSGCAKKGTAASQPAQDLNAICGMQHIATTPCFESEEAASQGQRRLSSPDASWPQKGPRRIQAEDVWKNAHKISRQYRNYTLQHANPQEKQTPINTGNAANPEV